MECESDSGAHNFGGKFFRKSKRNEEKSKLSRHKHYKNQHNNTEKKATRLLKRLAVP